MPPKITCGVIGAGRIGRMQIDNLLTRIPGVRLKTVAVTRLDESKNWLRELDIPRLTVDYHEIIADPEIEAVLIFSSTGTHAQFSVEAARAGKDVFCEKPIDAEIPRAREALRAIRETGIKYMIGFNRRFDHNHRRLRQLVAEGAVGKPRLIKLTSYDSTYDPDYIRQSARCGGMIFDMSVHDFDAARYLMQAADPGNTIDEVYASGSTLLDDPCFKEAGDCDTLVAVLRFQDGAMAVVHNSREAVYGYDQRIEILGAKGGAVEDNDAPSTVRLYTRDAPTFDKMPWFFTERYAEAFLEELREFFACIGEDRPPLVTGEDCLQAMLVAAAAQKSLAEHRPVKMEEVE